MRFTQAEASRLMDNRGLQALGGKVVREAGPMKHGTTVIAFLEDPDGYKVELIQTT